MKTRLGVVLLLVLGLAQMTGDVLGITPLKAVAGATAASPMPKVFSAVQGFETFTTLFLIEWDDTDGVHHSLEITAELNQRFKGPYNRRNIYGAALSYGPVLEANPHTRPLLRQVLKYALCGDAPILKEIGVDTSTIVQPIKIYYMPKQNPRDLPLVLEVPCSE